MNQGFDFSETDEARVHLLAIKLAVECARQSAELYADTPDDIARGALLVISQDAVVTHRAVAELVRSGWSGSSGSLLRTLFDILIATTAITCSQKPKLMAFRYFYSGFRTLARDHPTVESRLRARARQEIRDRIASLPSEDRPDALQFLKERDRPYFFSEEWKSPSDVLGILAVADLNRAYRELSSAAHGGFLGMRLLREDPDDRGINPQLPPGPRALSALILSARLLVEITSLRGRVEGLRVEPIAQALRHDIRQVGGFLLNRTRRST